MASPHVLLGNDLARQYVTFSWLAAPADARAAHWQHHMHAAGPAGEVARAMPLLPRALERLRPRGALGWQALLAAAAVGANVAALVYVARRAWLAWGEEQERAKAEEEQQEVTCAALAYLQRLWDVAMQAGGRAPADLGEPDEDGVYTYEGRGGAKLYFRLAPRTRLPGAAAAAAAANGGGSLSGGAAVWQWSTSRRLWLPTSAADSIWCHSGDRSANPGLGGRLLIRRLELESRLSGGSLCRDARAAAEPLLELPPLEIPALGGRANGINGAAAAGAALSGPATANGTPRNGTPRAGVAAVSGGGGAASGGSGACCGAAAVAALLADVPDSFLCPLSQRVMTDPVVTPGGITYDRGALRDWIKRNGTDPVTGHPLEATQLYSNLNLRDQICDYFIVRKDRGSPSAASRPEWSACSKECAAPDVAPLRDCDTGP